MSGPNSRSAVCAPSTDDRAGDIDLGRADEPSALGVVVREIDVFRRDARHLDAVDGRVAVGDARARLRVEHHGRDQRAVAA